MGNILVKATHGMDDVTLSTVAFIQAKVALEKGHKVRLWLFGEAVHLRRPDVITSIKAPGLPALQELVDAMKGKVEYFVCKPCAVARGLPEDPDAKFAGMPDYLDHLTNWATNSDSW